MYITKFIVDGQLVVRETLDMQSVNVITDKHGTTYELGERKVHQEQNCFVRVVTNIRETIVDTIQFAKGMNNVD